MADTVDANAERTTFYKFSGRESVLAVKPRLGGDRTLTERDVHMDTAPSFNAVAENWVWSADELAASDDWIIRLDADALDDIAKALDSVKRRNLALKEIAAIDFPLPVLQTGLAAIRTLLTDGPGVGLIRGLPVERYDADDLRTVLWGIGAHLGTGVTQSYRGDLIGDVMDMSHTGDTRRSYRSPRPLTLHVDPVDVVGLLCLRKAKEGGTSLITSGLAVHNAILANRPDLLPALYRGYHYRHSEAASTGRPPTTPYRVPVFESVGGRLVCNFNAPPISRSFAEDDIENDATALEAFEHFKATTARDDLLYRMELEPGDLQFLNNRAVLHGRTEFEDFPELGRKRHMLRLWLTMPDWPTMPEEMKWHGGATA